jgi:hypothetical protein
MAKWANTTINKSGFTDDVISFVTTGERLGSTVIRDAVRKIEDPKAKVAMIQRAMIDVVSPFMALMPPFIQQIVGRAFMEHVDWQAVIDRIQISPEDN